MVPDQPPDAAQLVALVDDHVSLEVAPDDTDVGEALSVSVGAVPTETVLQTIAVPPRPTHSSLYFVVAVNALVVTLPDSAFEPDHPPDAEQLVALVDDHVSFDVPPEGTEFGEADRVTVGAGPTVTFTAAVFEPPAPVHVSLNVVVAVNPLVVWLPDSVFEPHHPPDAVQLVALVEPHQSLVVAPGASAVGHAVRLTVGAVAASVSFVDRRAIVPNSQIATELAYEPDNERSRDILRITIVQPGPVPPCLRNSYLQPLKSTWTAHDPIGISPIVS